MDPRLLFQLQFQALLMCDFVMMAAEDLENALKKKRPRGVGNTECFYHAQSLINGAANLSKVLWGAGGRRTDERFELRKSIGIRESSPLKNVDMRNNFEHFDERLETWLTDSKRHNAIDLGIAPKSAIKGIDNIDRFRILDESTWNLYFFGDTFNLRDIKQEVSRVLPSLRAVVAQGPRWVIEPESKA